MKISRLKPLLRFIGLRAKPTLVGNMYLLATLQKPVASYDNPLSRLQARENFNQVVFTQPGPYQPHVDPVVFHHKHLLELAKGHNGCLRNHHGCIGPARQGNPCKHARA